MKKILKIIFVFILISFYSNFVFAEITDIKSKDEIRSSMTDLGGSPGILNVSSTGEGALNGVFNTIISYTFGFLALIVIAVFLYIGFIFITSQGNEEKFKKAWKMFTYTVIGLAIISLSWAAVKLVSSLSI